MFIYMVDFKKIIKEKTMANIPNAKIDNQMSFLDSYVAERSEKSSNFKKAYEDAGKQLDIALMVRNLRKSRNLSQQELAARAEKPQSTIGRIENGTMKPSLEMLNCIADATNTELCISFISK